MLRGWVSDPRIYIAEAMPWPAARTIPTRETIHQFGEDQVSRQLYGRFRVLVTRACATAIPAATVTSRAQPPFTQSGLPRLSPQMISTIQTTNSSNSMPCVERPYGSQSTFGSWNLVGSGPWAAQQASSHNRMHTLPAYNRSRAATTRQKGISREPTVIWDLNASSYSC